jgi:8-oxo-dGTP pyrophosphatase MutT (NUDIX family)
MKWTVHGRRTLYESDWVNLSLEDVELAEGRRLEHHVIRMPRQSVAVVVRDDANRVLLLWRHRFITDTWGWEIPAGRLEPGESPEQAAARETEEETGWRPGPLRPLGAYAPSNGSSDQRFHLFVADGATHIGDPSDVGESERIAWHPVEGVRGLITRGEVHDGLSLTALLWALAFPATLGV